MGHGYLELVIFEDFRDQSKQDQVHPDLLCSARELHFNMVVFLFFWSFLEFIIFY